MLNQKQIQQISDNIFSVLSQDRDQTKVSSLEQYFTNVALSVAVVQQTCNQTQSIFIFPAVMGPAQLTANSQPAALSLPLLNRTFLPPLSNCYTAFQPFLNIIPNTQIYFQGTSMADGLSCLLWQVWCQLAVAVSGTGLSKSLPTESPLQLPCYQNLTM